MQKSFITVVKDGSNLVMRIRVHTVFNKYEILNKNCGCQRLIVFVIETNNRCSIVEIKNCSANYVKLHSKFIFY